MSSFFHNHKPFVGEVRNDGFSTSYRKIQSFEAHAFNIKARITLKTWWETIVRLIRKRKLVVLLFSQYF